MIKGLKANITVGHEIKVPIQGIDYSNVGTKIEIQILEVPVEDYKEDIKELESEFRAFAEKVTDETGQTYKSRLE